MNRSDEEWRTVVGHQYYEVSNLGRVRSIDRTILCADGRTRTFKGTILKPSTDKRLGYKRVALFEGSKQFEYTVHSLVASAFIGPRPTGLDIRHKDGDHSNNSASNLEYGTRSENMQDSLRHGTNARSNRTQCPRNHLLIEPNLVSSKLAKGKRECLACARARGYWTNHQEMDLDELRNDYYRKIME